MLRGDVHEDDRVIARWEGSQRQVMLEVQPRPAKTPIAAPAEKPRRGGREIRAAAE